MRQDLFSVVSQPRLRPTVVLAAVLWGLSFGWSAQGAFAAEPLPLFDAHLHYNLSLIHISEPTRPY